MPSAVLIDHCEILADNIVDLSDFDYHLPAELIAQKPIEGRSGSRMLTVNQEGCQLKHFYNLPELLNPGDCLVLNNTKGRCQP